MYYHGYFDVIYGFLLIPSGILKILIGSGEPLILVSTVLTVVFCIFELFRLNFGYRGNINESYPELIAFVMQTILFSIAFVIVPAIAPFKFPHEDALYIINLVFLLLETVVGLFVMRTFSNT